MSTDTCVLTQAWALAARRQKDQRSEHQLAIGILESLFEGSCDPDTASSSLAALYESLLKQEIDEVGQLWNLMCDAIKVLGFNLAVDERLTRLIDALARLVDVTDKHGKAIKSKYGGCEVYWRDLPAFAMLFREYAMGQKIYKLCKCNQAYHNLEQWAEWKRSLDTVAAMVGLQSRVKHKAWQACEEMREIESNM